MRGIDRIADMPLSRTIEGLPVDEQVHVDLGIQLLQAIYEDGSSASFSMTCLGRPLTSMYRGDSENVLSNSKQAVLARQCRRVETQKYAFPHYSARYGQY